MNTISLGPLAIPLPLLLVFLASLAAQWMYSREVDHQQVEQARRGERGLFIALMAGVLGARLVYVLTWSSAYLAAPWSVLNIRDGGFHAWGGVLSALAALLWMVWRGYGPPRALATAGGAALVAFSLALFGSQHYLQALHPPLPDLPLQTLDGRQQSLQAWRGRPLVINVWATWCGPCRREMPVLAEAQRTHVDVDIVFANQGEAASEVTAFLEHSALDLQNVLLDPGSEVSRHYGVRGFPTTLFIDAEGRLQHARVGELSMGSLAEGLAAIRP